MKERFLQLFENKGIKNPNEFAILLNYSSPEKINRLLRDDKNMPSAEILTDIANKFADVNINWLLTGKGSMLTTKEYTDSEEIITTNEPAIEYERKRKGIPLIPISATAGFSNMDVQILEHDVEEYFNIPFLSEKADFAIGINGDSMSPLYEDKSFIICKKISVNEMIWEGVYLITVNGSSMVKRIYPSINPGCILCRSDNPRFRDFDILKSDITSIAKILSSIRIN